MLVKRPSRRHGDDHDDRGVAQLGAGRPGGLLQLTDHFAEEDAGAAERIFHGQSGEDLAGAEGIEPPTNGFGDRYSTN